jgi:hypothetical protein
VPVARRFSRHNGSGQSYNIHRNQPPSGKADHFAQMIGRTRSIAPIAARSGIRFFDPAMCETTSAESQATLSHSLSTEPTNSGKQPEFLFVHDVTAQCTHQEKLGGVAGDGCICPVSSPHVVNKFQCPLIVRRG